jgi:hypothetical protein
VNGEGRPGGGTETADQLAKAIQESTAYRPQEAHADLGLVDEDPAGGDR